MTQEENLLHNIFTKLKPGDIIKNYKELCSILELPVLAGNSKKYQLKDLTRYFDFKKEGQKIIVLEVYSSPKEKEDKRIENSVYLKYIQIILMDLLVNRMDEKLSYSTNKKQLYLDLGMINEKYKRNNIVQINNSLSGYGITDYDLETFYDKCGSRLSDILESGLHGLENRRLIDYAKVRTIMVKNNEDGIDYIKPDDLLMSQILDVEYQTLQEMGYESMTQIKAARRMKDFYIIRNKKAQELYDWFGIQEQYHIVYREDHIRETLPKDKLLFNKLLLNEKVIEALNRSFEIMVNNRNQQAELEHQDELNKRPKLMIGTRTEPTKEELGIFYYENEKNLKTKMNGLIQELVSIQSTDIKR